MGIVCKGGDIKYRLKNGVGWGQMLETLSGGGKDNII